MFTTGEEIIGWTPRLETWPDRLFLVSRAQTFSRYLLGVASFSEDGRTSFIVVVVH
jgi:hypothetical protein